MPLFFLILFYPVHFLLTAAFPRCNSDKLTLEFVYANPAQDPYDLFASTRRSTCGKRAATINGSGSYADPYVISVDLSRGLVAQTPDCGVVVSSCCCCCCCFCCWWWWWWWWSLLYSVVLRFWADSLHSCRFKKTLLHVLNIHGSAVLTALFECCMDGATWKCCRLGTFCVQQIYNYT